MAYQTIASKQELKEYARLYASRLKAGDVIGLVGELGAGKTTLTQYIGEYLGVCQPMRSPTFTYIKIYPINHGNILVHCDAYRLDGSDDIHSIGLDDYLSHASAIVIIEWADKIRDALPQKTHWITLKSISQTKRILTEGFKEKHE